MNLYFTHSNTESVGNRNGAYHSDTYSGVGLAAVSTLALPHLRLGTASPRALWPSTRPQPQPGARLSAVHGPLMVKCFCGWPDWVECRWGAMHPDLHRSSLSTVRAVALRPASAPERESKLTMNTANWIVVTTINPPTETVRRLVELCPQWQILVVGDRKTPKDWRYPGVRFLSIEEQGDLEFALARKSPFNHYVRKNLGYLLAIAQGAQAILETDDDNIPYDWYPGELQPVLRAAVAAAPGWHNVYRHFSTARIWPRGFPLEHVNASFRELPSLSPAVEARCAIQQFLADGNPDVDAVFRLTTEGAIHFKGEDIALGPGTWSPFNSQNTLWWSEAFPFLYLPCSATFRMTDIWRSFVAQICLHASGGHVAFRNASMFQERNDHSLIRDFADEVPGYLNNHAIVERLSQLPLSGTDATADLRACYADLTAAGYLKPEEQPLVDSWLEDLRLATQRASARVTDPLPG